MLIGKALRRRATQHAANRGRQPDAINQILARHFVIHAKRIPAQSPIRLPLRLAMPARDARAKTLPTIRIAPNQHVLIRAHFFHRHLHHHAGFRVNGQEGRIGGAAIRPECRQDHFQHLGMVFRHSQQRRIKLARTIVIGRRREFVLKAKSIQKGAQPRIIMVPEAFMCAERVRDRRDRPADMPGQHFLIRHIIRHLAQPIHVIAEGDQARRQARELRKGLADPACARHFAESADMRQAGRAIAGFKQRRAFAGSGQAGRDLARLLKGPGLHGRKISSGGHWQCLSLSVGVAAYREAARGWRGLPLSACSIFVLSALNRPLPSFTTGKLQCVSA